MKKTEIKKIIKKIEKDIRQEAMASIEMTHDAEEMLYIALDQFETLLSEHLNK